MVKSVMSALQGDVLCPRGMYSSALIANAEQDLVLILSSIVNMSQADAQQFRSFPTRDNLGWCLGSFVFRA